MTAAASERVRTTDVLPDELASWMDAGDTVVIDCREHDEYSAERIAGAVLRPLSSFDADAVRSEFGGKRVVFQCRTGRRSLDAAAQYGHGAEQTFHLAGGIEAWKSAGRDVVRAAGRRLAIMRQVQIVAGGLVVVGVTLGLLVSPWFFGIAGFVGCGLVFAGLSGWCGMAKLLAGMPWNRAAG